MSPKVTPYAPAHPFLGPNLKKDAARVGGARPVLLTTGMRPVGPADLLAMTEAPSKTPVASAVAKALGTEPAVLDLIPGRYPDAVGLNEVLRMLAEGGQAVSFVDGFIQSFQRRTGIVIPADVKASVLARPGRLGDIFQARPEDIAAGLDAANKAYQAGVLKPTKPKSRILPQELDFAKLGAVAYERKPSELKVLAKSDKVELVQGDLPNTRLSDEQAKRNTVVAEVLDRLAENTGKPAAEKFQVRYAIPGRPTSATPITGMAELFQRLRDDGHQITARIQHRIANFADLKARFPDGRILDVPASLMVRIQLPDGGEVSVPTVHSEVVYSIRSTKKTKGPGIDADVKYYQGVPHTGFFPADLSLTPTWLGMKVADRFHGQKAIDAALLAGTLGNAIEQAASKQGLYMSGYGATGVCNDSVSIVQHAMTGRVTGFPLLMKDPTVLGTLEALRDKTTGAERERYQRLIDSVKQVPSDAVDNDTLLYRARASIPWVRELIPLYSTAAAVQGLDQALK